MKHFTLKFFALLFILSQFIQAQDSRTQIKNSKTDNLIRCASDEYNSELLKNNPNMMGSPAFEDLIEVKVNEARLQNQNNNRQMVVVTIPVVVHVLHNGEAVGTGPNITDAQVISQINVLNEDYRKIAGTPGGTNNSGAAVDVEVEFCLAQIDPNGNPTNGIDRVNIGQNGIFETSLTDAQNQMDALKPNSIWDPSQYMNMWSVGFNGFSGLLGYAQFPQGPANTDGVVSDYRFFGSSDYDDGSFNLSAPYDKGRTMTHEVGHFLGLFHTFQGGCAGTGATGGDFCADTPAVATSNGGCPTGIDSCPSDSGSDMVENYMDYTDDACMDTFTADQKARILAVLATSVNRASLTSSNVCTTSPLINFNSNSPSPGQMAEGSDCNFTDIDIDLNITMAPNSNAIVSLVNSGTATENEDFELINNAVTFASGSTTPSNAITLRIYNDNFVESDETIILSLNLTTPADASAVTSTYNLTIGDDDIAVNSSGNSTLFFDGFENYADFTITPVGGWTLIDNDGDSTYSADNFNFTNEGYTGSFIVFNSSSTTPAANTGWDAHSGNKGYYCFNSTGSVSGSPLNDDYAITPQVNLNGTGSELKFWAKSLTDNYAGGERFQVAISTTNTNASSFTTISTAPYIVPPLDWTEYTYDLSAYDGMSIYVAIHVVSADEFVFMLDDISITADVTTNIQTAVNSTSPDQFNLPGAGLAYSTDVTTGNVMLDINNTSGFDYGCTTVAVSRDASTAGAAAVAYNGSTNTADFVTAKTFDITTTNDSASEASTVNFYFTQAEITAWETTTGNTINELYALNDTSGEVVALTNSAFGSDYKLTANFTEGLEGTYYFGKQTTLSLNDIELGNSISIYPNPTISVLNIKVTDQNDMPENYKIYNMLGQLLIDKTINNTSDLSVDTTPFSNGMYFIKISKSNRNLTLPFIKK